MKLKNVNESRNLAYSLKLQSALNDTPLSIKETFNESTDLVDTLFPMYKREREIPTVWSCEVKGKRCQGHNVAM